MTICLGTALFTALAIFVSTLTGASGTDPTSVIKLIAELGGRVEEVDQKDHKIVVTVNLRSTQANDDTILALEPLKHVSAIFLDGTRITDKGVESLQRMKSLRIVNLNRTVTSDVAAMSLLDMKALEQLYLYDTRFTDKGVGIISKSISLSKLWLDGPNITDDCIPALATMQRLDMLILSRTKITADGKDNLQKRRPSLNIIMP